MKIRRIAHPYLLINIAAFYLLPMMIKNTGTAMVVMLVGLPVICLIISIIFGAKHGFNGLYCLAVPLLFTSTIFIYYNYTAWIYIIVYGLLALVGNVIGNLFYKSGKSAF